MTIFMFTVILTVLLVYLYRVALSHVVTFLGNLWARLPGNRSAERFKVVIAVALSFALIAPLVAITGAGMTVGMANIAAHLVFALIMFLGIDRKVPVFQRMVEKI